MIKYESVRIEGALFLQLFVNYNRIITKKRWTLEELAVSFWSFSTKSLLEQHGFLLTQVFRVSKNSVGGGVPV